MDRGAWQTMVHGVTESDTAERLTLSTFLPRVYRDVWFERCLINKADQQDDLHEEMIFIINFGYFP